MAVNRIYPRWSAWWPFALLCLLGATRGMVTGAFPTSITTLLSASAGCALAAIVAASVALLTRRTSQPVFSAGISLRSTLAGALLISGPLAALLLTGRGIDPNALTLALALVPVVATIAESALNNSPPGSFAARTWPALAALTGLLLLVPQPTFSHFSVDVVLIAAPLATGIGAALFITTPRNQRSFTHVLSAATLLFAIAWLTHHLLHETTTAFSPLAALLDAAAALLTLLALSRVSLTRWTAQFAIVPLAVVLQGFVLLHPGFDVYASAGTILLLLGSIFLLLPQPSEKPF